MTKLSEVCAACGKKEKLHVHHIIPRSRGGDDSPNNLISLCIECHGLAHNVDFKDNTGLVAAGLKTAQEEAITAAIWLEANESFVNEKLMECYDRDTETYNMFICLLDLGLINTRCLFKLFNGFPIKDIKLSRNSEGVKKLLYKIQNNTGIDKGI